MLDKNLPPINPGIPLPVNPPPFPPVPLDPVRLEAAFKVQQSQEYADLKAALGDFGRVTYDGKSYSANSLDKLVGELVNVMAKATDAAERSYIPPSQDVLVWTNMVETGQTARP